MEGVAIAIAKKALGSVVSTATTAITDEIGLLLGVQEELFFIKEELEMMQAFLREATREEVKGETVITWVKQVQELSYDVEDCLQEASVHLMKKGCLNAILSSKERDRIAQMIKVLKVRIVDVSQRNLRYGLIKSSNKNVPDDSLEKPVPHWNAIEEASVVGLHKPKLDLLKLILEKCDALKVVLVIGMGGLGKTTLVKSVYGNSELSNEFKCFAWITVLHPLNKEEFILSLATQFSLTKIDLEEDETKKMKKMISFIEGDKTKGMKKRRFDIGELEKMIIDHVKDKRFILVLDDLANEMEWSNINHIFENAVKGSRIIVTTRSESLEAHISQFKVTYKIKPLSKDDSHKLFYRAVFKNSDYSPTTYGNKHNNDHLEESSFCMNITVGKLKQEGETTEESSSRENITGKVKQVGGIKEESGSRENITGKTKKVGEITEEWSSYKNITQKGKHMGQITEEMKKEADKIIERCGQLPLAIVAIGSFLATRPKTSVEWKNMHDHITSEIGINPHLKNINKVLTTSYDGLPNNLKPCFLYLSVFRNHQEIRRSRIVRRWMAEGFLMERSDMTAEEVGEHHFYDLMGRSLIQPSEPITIENDAITRCNIHDLIYEMLVAKSEHEKVVSFFGDRSRVNMNNKGRHIVLKDGMEEKNNPLQRMKLSNIRSLTGFGKVGSYVAYHKMRLLRVLDLEGTLGLKNRDIRKIGKLRHLKYLGLRGTTITKLPGSLEKLHDLETLDIRDTWVLDLPRGIVKLQKLSYLRAGFDVYKRIELISRYEPSKFLDILLTVYVTLLFTICFLPILGCYFCYSSRAMDEAVDDVSNCKCICGNYLLEALEGPIPGTNYGSIGFKAPLGMRKMRSLSNFGTVDIGQSMAAAKELKYLSNLTKIAIVGFFKKNGKVLGEAIEELIHLKSLVLAASDRLGLGCCLESINIPPKYLQSLKLFSPIDKLPNWFSSLDNLVKLYFRDTMLGMKDIKAIEMLPNLKILFMLRDSFNERPLYFGPNTFPTLQVMFLDCYAEWTRREVPLTVWIEKNALQRLAHLTIHDKESSILSSELESRNNGSEVLVARWELEGLENLKSLKEVVLDDLNVDVVKSVKDMILRNPNKPNVRCLNIPTMAEESV